ncbi:LPXTG cell wall anchor domain-containing protein [Actinoplanes sp. NPDC020271]|uniref:LPXTG cell wall anchor domain-containing protein n=1 Tax=Actinoplanes sp. NPDC020271 TaxID=3363896 RepID=UPI0037B732B9
MRSVRSSLRRRGALIAAGAAALVVAITAALMVNTGAAAATWKTLAGTPTCDCVLQNSKDNTYRAIFGYVSTANSAGTIAAGDNNKVVLNGGSTRSTAAEVTTRFEPGTHKATFATGWLAKDTAATWTVGGKTVTASWNKPTCGADVSLPASGNGSGPLIALIMAGVVAAFVFWRKRRKAA